VVLQTAGPADNLCVHVPTVSGLAGLTNRLVDVSYCRIRVNGRDFFVAAE
jgi:hypothetical protein